MITENPSGEFKYTVGNYSIAKTESGEWELYHEGKHEATFYNRDKVLRYAVIQYTCGDMVAEGIRDLLKIAIAEKS